MSNKTAPFAIVMILAVASIFAFASPKNSPTDAKNAVATITQMENDAVNADLAGDSSFYNRNLAENWTGGTSFGTWDTKQSLLGDMKDTDKNSTKSEAIKDLNVRVYGSTAIATYTTTYDSMRHGERVARTVLSTDTFVNENGTWKQVAGHSSEAAK
ncbi:MAG TPA: nuclear transport factor 2 family protein [Terriglobales bacterium]|jgi:hypothetical protein|nr:nuclear transport factor 2 family protein [Terriglobales bacterium]